MMMALDDSIELTKSVIPRNSFFKCRIISSYDRIPVEGSTLSSLLHDTYRMLHIEKCNNVR